MSHLFGSKVLSLIVDRTTVLMTIAARGTVANFLTAFTSTLKESHEQLLFSDVDRQDVGSVVYTILTGNSVASPACRFL